MDIFRDGEREYTGSISTMRGILYGLGIVAVFWLTMALVIVVVR